MKTYPNRVQYQEIVELVEQALPLCTREDHLDKAVEEAAELIEAVVKEKHGRATEEDIAGEACDCVILGEFIRQLIGDERFDMIMKQKLNRLRNRIECGDMKASL